MKRARTGKSPRRKRTKTTPSLTFSYATPRRRTRTERVTQELKFLDTDIVDGTIAANMTKFNPQVIPQGDEESQRIGRKVIIKSLSIKGTLQLIASTSGASSSEVLVMKVIHDSQTNGAEFATAQLLEADTFDSYNNLANRNRFRILKAEYFEFSAGGAAPTGAALIFSEVTKVVDCHLKMNISVEYDNSFNTGVIGTVTSNSIWVVFQTLTGELISSNLKMRIRYTD